MRISFGGEEELLVFFFANILDQHPPGIVTEFTVKTRPIGEIWGGLRIYDSSHDSEIFRLMHEFIPTMESDPKGTIIHTGIIAVGGVTTSFLWFFYDGPEPPTTGPYAELTEIPSLVSTAKTQSYSSLLKANGDFGGLIVARDSFTVCGGFFFSFFFFDHLKIAVGRGRKGQINM